VNPGQPRLRVYRLHEGGTLTRLAMAGPSPGGHVHPLADQLRLVQWADVDQVPLAVLTSARSPLGPGPAAMGAAEPVVREYLVRQLLAALILAAPGTAPAPAPARRFQRGPLGGRLELEPVELPAPFTLDWLCAGSLGELQVALAERAAASARREPLRWRPVDLLREPSASGEVAYLQQVMAVRRRVDGWLAETAAGLWLYVAGGSRGASFARDQALAHCLVREVWREFYGGEAPSAVIEPRPELADQMLEKASQWARSRRGAGAPHTVMAMEARCWGSSIWIGCLEPEGEQP
jgi:hypothetical protein